MAFGDIGGTVTELVITCQTPASGTVSIEKGDAVALIGPYTVDNTTDAEDPVFGQAMAGAAANDAAIPVKVRGICVWQYTGDAPPVDGATGIVASDQPGKVKAPQAGAGFGVNLKTDAAQSLVHVLL